MRNLDATWNYNNNALRVWNFIIYEKFIVTLLHGVSLL